jgi:lantibiotic modifying enzyme
MFASKPSSVDLFTAHGDAIPGFFRDSGLSSAIERIEAMSEDDLQHQRWVVEASLVALLPGMHVAPMRDGVVPEPHVPRGASGSTRDAALRAARRVAERLVTRALRQKDHISWLGLTLLRERDWTIQPVGSDLYSGAAGIASFLAYFDHVAGDADSRAVARTVLRQLTRRLAEMLEATDSWTPFPPSSLGAFGALSGAVYTLSHIGALWADHDVINLAERLVVKLGDHIDADRTLDIIGGTAGFIAAASALEHVRSALATRRMLKHAAECVIARGEERAGGLSWSTSLPASQPLTGMSHGVGNRAGSARSRPPCEPPAVRGRRHARAVLRAQLLRSHTGELARLPILPGRDHTSRLPGCGRGVTARRESARAPRRVRQQ